MNGAGGAAGPVTGAGPSSHNISHKTQHSGKMTKDFVICSLTSKGTQLISVFQWKIGVWFGCLIFLNIYLTGGYPTVTGSSKVF